MTPILGILVAIGSGLALVAVAIILVLKFRPVYPGSSQGSNRRHKDRTYLSAPHLPLDRQHREMPDECIDMEEKDPDIIPTNKGEMIEYSFPPGEDLEPCFSSDIIEEEEAFQAYAEQRRYASTLGRNCLGSSGTRRREMMMTASEKAAASNQDEKMRNLKGNISRFVRFDDSIGGCKSFFPLFRAKKYRATQNGPCRE